MLNSRVHAGNPPILGQFWERKLFFRHPWWLRSAPKFRESREQCWKVLHRKMDLAIVHLQKLGCNMIQLDSPYSCGSYGCPFQTSNIFKHLQTSSNPRVLPWASIQGTYGPMLTGASSQAFLVPGSGEETWLANPLKKWKLSWKFVYQWGFHCHLWSPESMMPFW